MDDSLSGTTAVALYLEGRDMWVANVGDSRAIVVQEHEGMLVARPLSSDQTPYRKVNVYTQLLFNLVKVRLALTEAVGANLGEEEERRINLTRCPAPCRIGFSPSR